MSGTIWMDPLRGIQTTDSHADALGHHIERVRGSNGAWAWEKRRGFITIDADETGSASAVTPINSALSSARPGQCVYLPYGRYKIDHSAPIVIPQGVTFCGDARGHHMGPLVFNNGQTSFGTQLNVIGTGPLFELQQQATIADLTFFYPNQVTDAAPTTYGVTIHCVANSHGCTIKNICGINPYDFIQIGDHAPPYAANGVRIDNIWGYPLHRGIELGRCADVSRISNVQFNRSTYYAHGTNLINAVLSTASAFVVDGAEDFHFTDCFAFKYYRGLYFHDVDGDGFKGVHGSWKGGSLDSCGVCVLVDEPNGLQLAGLALSDCRLSSLGNCIQFSDTAVVTDNARPTIWASNVRFLGVVTRAVQLVDQGGSGKSYGRYSQVNGSVYSNSQPAFHAHSDASFVRLIGVDVNAGVGLRTAGPGTVIDAYGSTP